MNSHKSCDNKLNACLLKFQSLGLSDCSQATNQTSLLMDVVDECGNTCEPAEADGVEKPPEMGFAKVAHSRPAMCKAVQVKRLRMKRKQGGATTRAAPMKWSKIKLILANDVFANALSTSLLKATDLGYEADSEGEVIEAIWEEA